MRKKDWLAGGIIIGGLFLVLLIFVVILAAAGMKQGGGFTATGGREQIGYVSVSSIIISPDAVLEQLTDLEENDRIKAVLVRLDSPGGVPAASQAIYAQLKALRAAGKKVVVSMGNTAASGAYYIACGADTIMANPATITGSIGVRTEFMTYKKLAETIGIKTHTVTTGKYKSLGSPTREPRADELALLKSVSTDIYDQFVEDVAASRGLDESDVRELADGRVYTGRQALENGLVDMLGNLNDAIALTGRMAGIEGRPGLLKKKKRMRFMDYVQEYSESALQKAAGALAGRYRLYYM